MVQAPVTRLKMQLVGHMLPAATLHQALPEQSLVWPATGGSVICFLGLRGMVLHAEQLHQKLKKNLHEPIQTWSLGETSPVPPVSQVTPPSIPAMVAMASVEYKDRVPYN